jgi:outer membrane lipoprotein carrier protein
MVAAAGLTAQGFAPALQAAEAVDVVAALGKVEQRYNRAKTMQLAFQQSLTGGPGLARTETGDLFLAKPGRMLWRYKTPMGKLFLVDGKFVWFYTPTSKRVEKSPVKESDDLRAPLAFLLGQLDFKRFFDTFRSKQEGANLRISARPKSKRAPYSEVEFVITPASEISNLRVLGLDGSVMEFAFSGLQANPKLEASLFTFQPIAGADVVEVQNP